MLTDLSAPQVSVLIVAHNAGRYLRPAVESILSQQDVTLEVVLVDCGSTDGSLAFLRASNPDSRLRIVWLEENRLHVGGLIAGFPHCSGRFVAMMDADNLSLPGRLCRQASYLRDHPEVNLIGCLADKIDPEGRPMGPWFSVVRPEDIRAYNEFDMPFPLTGAMASRTWWSQLGWREEFRYAHDFDLLMRAVETGRVACLPEVLYRYRIHPQSITHTRKEEVLLSASFVRLAGARRRAGRPERLDEIEGEFRAWESTTFTKADVYAQFSRRYVAEGFGALGLMYARRACAGGRWQTAITAALRALFCERGRRRFLLRLALLGPAHALRVRSIPPLPSRWPTLFKSNF